MPITKIPGLDHAPQVAAEWLNEFCEDLDPPGKRRACLLLRETLPANRDCLPVDEAVDTAAPMPPLGRGISHEGRGPSRPPSRAGSREDPVAGIASRLAREPLEDSERTVPRVSDLLRRHISAGAPDPVRRAIGELWT